MLVIEKKLILKLPLISSSAQYDFFPLAASSLDIIVYIRLGSGGSYFSLGIPVILKKGESHFHWLITGHRRTQPKCNNTL